MIEEARTNAPLVVASDGLTKKGIWFKKSKGGPLFNILKKVAEAKKIDLYNKKRSSIKGSHY